MELKESLDTWGADLGGLMGNMLTFEFSLRTFLGNEEFMHHTDNKHGGNYDILKVGDTVPENAFTNYDSLGELISKYNRNPKVEAAGYRVDPTLTEIRDCFAHGRAAQFSQDEHAMLLKFSRPSKEHTVVVTHYMNLTHECLSEYAERFATAITTVITAHKRFQ